MLFLLATSLGALAEEPKVSPLLTDDGKPIVLTPRSQAGVLMNVGGVASIVAGSIAFTQADSQLTELELGSYSTTGRFNHDRRAYNRLRAATYFFTLSGIASLTGGTILLCVDNFGQGKPPEIALEVRHEF